MVEYYTGRDASAMSDEALAQKLAHIDRIRKMESEESIGKVLKNLLG
jgi:hypothetical protein